MSEAPIHYFAPAFDLPDLFPSPFNQTPHPLARQAAGLLQSRLSQAAPGAHDFQAADGGKMFGVLVVRDGAGRIGYLSAFSGMLAGCWQWPGFVPPVFDQQARQAFLAAGEAELKELAAQIDAMENGAERQQLLRQLEQRQRERDEALAMMVASHRACRERRHQLRSKAAGDEALLARLARESREEKRQRRELKAVWRERISAVTEPLATLEGQINALKKRRARLSGRLQAKLFSGYRLRNYTGEERAMNALFDQGRVPGGAGDCAAPKLIHYAQRQRLRPVALAEFWWGAPPSQAVRHHGYFYPACRGKCRPILTFMLHGLELAPAPPLGSGIAEEALETVFEDDDLVVLNKPHGLLSVPGKEIEDSVLSRLRSRYPRATGALLVHRLDLSTSGLLLAAKRASIHKALQRQFLQRTIEKRYVALLSERLGPEMQAGEIDLPLRVDLDDRPRQVVCFEHGKQALTRWRVVAREGGLTRVHFYPVTGRTHQLRLHAAHPLGLSAPIKGDELYGDGEGRLRLHAERLVFEHPVTGRRIELEAQAPF